MNWLLETALPVSADSRPAFRLLQALGLAACAALTLFVLATLAFGRYPSQVQYGTALALGLVAIFCLKPMLTDREGRRSRLDLWLSLLLIAATLFAWAYMTREYQAIANFREGLPNDWDLAAYAIGTLVVVFGAHRAEGWMLTAVVLAAAGYLLFGHVMPGILEHRPFSLSRVLEISYSYRGIFGVALGSVVDIVLIFVILGTVLRLTGAGELFNDVALMLTRGRRSGPAQCAILASSMFGSINGSAPANVASTGVLTIPLMKRAGFSGRFAGGVEATASCVGQIMPPVMGVGAFIMSDITGIPYVEIMAAAIVPAFLYLFSLSTTVALEAGRLQLNPLDQPPPPWDRARLSRAALLLLGFGLLLALLFLGYPPTYCGLIAIGVMLLVAMLLPDTRLGAREWLLFVVEGGRDGLSVLLSCAAIGIVIAAITSTGLGVALNQQITALGGQNLLAALLLAALCSIVLGMGLPTAASYLMVIFVAGPAIMELGVSKLGTHLFVFYYAALSAITPPVALAVFAAAAIARENPIPLALNALRLAAVGFVLPIAWVFHPEIVIGTKGTGVLEALEYLPFLLVGIVGFAASHVGYLFGRLGVAERLAMAAGAALVLAPGLPANAAGVALVALPALIRLARSRHAGAA
ncbi:TRAP transporter, 4TM/12TM fusion protein [Tistlia consotensis]|uniref:TRAP transporter, 4TM/12TM fusion protein n=1 Tax=Tistlia consotensis USBA 355 TaxID=560819 RepID=A0A1Y6BQG7_9PROT|nr:TRAP transporter fused permease subunit [Tistlia consotensis]SMF22000.1 TRAP transporter, 4TM/12TM fusion protein [Tistlia consotensis USBA 355]SNR46389.1 TRAP transporter, 4TM/12TM fusion protein [Tistlia consotensis]